MRKSILLVYCIILLSFQSIALGLDRASVRSLKSLTETGTQFYENKDYLAAIKKFKEAYNLNPNDYIVKVNLINAYIGHAIKLKNMGDFDASLKTLNEALEIEDTVPEIHLILASIYYDMGDYVTARGELNIARIYRPDSSAICTMLGEVYFQEGKLEQALKMWTQSQKREPYNTGLLNKIERAKREWNIQKSFEVKRSHPFIIKYKKHNADLADKVLSILMDAYVNIGRKMNYFPVSNIIVIVYDNDDFYKATEARGTIASLYDGKIRLKVSDKLDNIHFLREILFHEYTHVLIRFISNDSCPFWLNEGLAQVLSDSSATVDLDALNNLELESDFFHLTNLETFNGLTKCREHDIDMDMSIKLAYLKSLITVNYITGVYGLDTCIELLKKLKMKKTVTEALSETIGLDINELDSIIEKKIYNAKQKLLKLNKEPDNTGH